MTTVVLVRHGETEWNATGRMQGWAPVPLNDRGRAQAEAAAPWLAAEFDVDRVHASDLRRARETVERLRPDLPVGADDVSHEPAWRERDLGVYQGMLFATVRERFPAFALGDRAARAVRESPESGESILAVRERVLDRFGTLVEAAGPDETVLVVAHGGPIRLLLGHARDWSIERAFLDPSIDNCGATVLAASDKGVDGDGPEVVRQNDTGWRADADLDGAE